MYTVNYVSKGQRGISELLQETFKAAKKGNFDNKKQIAVIGNNFLKHQKISAQEAVYICLHMRLKNLSCGHIFINTSPSDERPFIVKSIEELENYQKIEQISFCRTFQV